MRFSAAIILGVASLAAAQSTSTTTSAAGTASGSPSGCGTAIDEIITACLGSTEPGVKACAANDWKCMCSAQQAVVTCYNNCPSDPNAFGAQQQETSWCNAAKAYSTTSSAAAATGKNGGTTTMATSTTATANGPHTGFASASGSASASASATGAANALTPAGGFFAAVLGLALL